MNWRLCNWQLMLAALFLPFGLIACSLAGGDDEVEQSGEGTPVVIERVRLDTIEITERSMARSEAFSNPSVAPEVSGRVVEVLHDIGDRVEADAALARLDQAPYQLSLSAAQADATALQVRLEQYERHLDRLTRVGGGQYVSESDLEVAEADVNMTRQELMAAENRRDEAQRELEHTVIRAPITGRIDERLISAGDYANTGDLAFRMVPDASARVSFPYPERIGDRLEEGMTVQLRRLNREEEDWVSGHLTRIRPSVDGGMGTMVVVEFVPPESWRSGTMLEGLVLVEQRHEAMIVPSESIVMRPDKVVVFVLPGDRDYGNVEEREVTVGHRTAGIAELLDGVAPDERVVVDGAAYLTDGAPVRVRGE